MAKKFVVVVVVMIAILVAFSVSIVVTGSAISKLNLEKSLTRSTLSSGSSGSSGGTKSGSGQNLPPILYLFNLTYQLTIGESFVRTYRIVDPDYTSGGLKYLLSLDEGKGFIDIIDSNTVQQGDISKTFTRTFDTPGTKIFKLSATDPQGLTAETSRTIIVIPQRPDLIVESITPPTPLKKGVRAQIIVTVKNIGDKDSSSMSVKLKIGSNTYEKGGISVKAGKSQPKTFYHTFSSSGNHQVTATVDSGNHITEYNENNNQKIVTLTVQN